VSSPSATAGRPGTGSLGHLAENVAAGALRLTEQDLALLGSLA
jgi:pyridoxine 4-dehydrogenase